MLIVKANPLSGLEGALKMTSQRMLILGDPALQFPVMPRERYPILAVRLPPSTARGPATEWLKGEDTTTTSFSYVDRQTGTSRKVHLNEPHRVLRGAALDQPFADRVRAELGGCRDEIRYWYTPVAMVHQETSSGETVIYACSRIRQSGAIFGRVAVNSIERSDSFDVILGKVGHHLAEWQHVTANESGQTRRYDEDTEVEAKLTFADLVSPSRLAARFAEMVHMRQLDGFIPDVGNELQRWTYEQETFEISSPRPRIGYLAFMKSADGTYVIKEKNFERDALRRREVFSVGVELSGDGFDGYIRREAPELVVRRLPGFRRSRFDVNVESAVTGHFFGIEIDEVVVPTTGHVLQQLEVEYHKSRICEGVDPRSIESELFRLVEIVRGHLASWGIHQSLGYYSKLTFLKQEADSIERADI